MKKTCLWGNALGPDLGGNVCGGIVRWGGSVRGVELSGRRGMAEGK